MYKYFSFVPYLRVCYFFTMLQLSVLHITTLHSSNIGIFVFHNIAAYHNAPNERKKNRFFSHKSIPTLNASEANSIVNCKNIILYKQLILF